MIVKGISNDSIIKVWAENACMNILNLDKPNVRSLSWVKNNNFKRGLNVALVAAGPSLDDSVHKLKEIQESYFIIAADAALPHLRLHGVQPDLVVTIDPNAAVLKFYEFMGSGCTIVCPITTHHNIFTINNAKFFVFAQADSRFPDKDKALRELPGVANNRFPFIDNNYFVGATLLQVSDLLVPSEVVLFGYDFSYRSGRLYCEGTLRSKFGDNWISENDRVFDQLLANEKIMNFDRTIPSVVKAKTSVVTTGLLKLYLVTFNELVAKRSNIVNCSADLTPWFLPYCDYNNKEFKNEKDTKPNMWNLYTRKRHR